MHIYGDHEEYDHQLTRHLSLLPSLQRPAAERYHIYGHTVHASDRTREARIAFNLAHLLGPRRSRSRWKSDCCSRLSQADLLCTRRQGRHPGHLDVQERQSRQNQIRRVLRSRNYHISGKQETEQDAGRCNQGGQPADRGHRLEVTKHRLKDLQGRRQDIRSVPLHTQDTRFDDCPDGKAHRDRLHATGLRRCKAPGDSRSSALDHNDGTSQSIGHHRSPDWVRPRSLRAHGLAGISALWRADPAAPVSRSYLVSCRTAAFRASHADSTRPHTLILLHELGRLGGIHRAGIRSQSQSTRHRHVQFYSHIWTWTCRKRCPRADFLLGSIRRRAAVLSLWSWKGACQTRLCGSRQHIRRS